MKRQTYVRIAKAFKAALNLCARRDPRIRNSTAWRIGLSGISAQYESRNILRLTDKVIRAAIKAAYKLDRAFGLFVEVAAVTGARIGQIAKLLVADLRIDEGPPRLMMPSSQKGSRRKRIKRPPNSRYQYPCL